MRQPKGSDSFIFADTVSPAPIDGTVRGFILDEPSTAKITGELDVFAKIEAFVVDVGRMREAQKRYFRTKERTDLLVAKSIEQTIDRKVDAMLDVLRGRR
jgi:hypothetical protein